MNRSVLIVTPFFAPQTHAAVFRAYKLAKYLPQFGWKPYILTVDHHYLFNEDPSLLTALPPEIEITKARYIEPTLRGVRMALGGEDRSFAALKAKRSSSPETPSSAESSACSMLGHRLYRQVRESWMNVPDAHWTWYGPAVRAGRKLIRSHKIPLVFSTCMPLTAHAVGRTISRQEGCRWVADFRDLPTYASRMFSPIDRLYSKQRRIERNALIEADAITVTAASYAMVFRDMHHEMTTKPIHHIPTGVDLSLLDDSGAPSYDSPYIVFAGEFLPEYGGTFLETFAETMKRPEIRAKGIKLLFVGQAGLNQSRVAPWIERYGLAAHVEFVDHVPQGELYVLLRNALAGVLAPGRETHWWNCFAKLVDYIGLRTPVLAIVPDPSEARTQLTKAGLGVFLDGDVPACADTLARFFLNEGPGIRPNADHCDRFVVGTQVEAFANLFDQVLAKRKIASADHIVDSTSYIFNEPTPPSFQGPRRWAESHDREPVTKP